MCPISPDAADTQAEEADLEKLAAELAARGYHTTLQTPPGRLPHLDVSNPAAPLLTERVYASAGAFWFSWAERIAACDQVTAAACILARVLRTAGGEQPDDPPGR